MEIAVHGVLLDFEHLTLLTLAVGLLITAAIRTVRGNVLQNESGFGKVQTHAFGGVDLVATLMLVAFYYTSFLVGPRDEKMPVMSSDIVVMQLVMITFL